MAEKKVDLGRIVQFAVVDADGRWGYAAWNALSGIRIDPGTGIGTFVGQTGNVYSLIAADPSARVLPPLSADAPYQPDAPYNPDAPPNPEAP